MLVLFALAFVVLSGVLGLSVDLGFTALERRSLQKAADAAAMSGALDLIDSANWAYIQSDVDTMVGRNSNHGGITISCSLLGNNGAQLQANCASPTNTNTSAVRVVLTHTRDNYFMGVIGVQTTTVSAAATARAVKQTDYEGGNGLFLVCGYGTKLATGQTDSDGVNDGKTDILTASAPYDVKTTAIGKKFVIHDPQVTDCGIQSNSFKGLADASANQGPKTLPSVMIWDTGVKAGPTRTAVAGPNGCAGSLNSDNLPSCVMLLPIFIPAPGSDCNPPPSSKKADEEVCAVMWLPFLVEQHDANTHYGTLLSNAYQLQLTNGSTGSWTVQDPGLVSARLVN